MQRSYTASPSTLSSRPAKWSFQYNMTPAGQNIRNELKDLSWHSRLISILLPALLTISETYAFVPANIFISGFFLFIHCFNLPNAMAGILIWPFNISPQSRLKGVWFFTNSLSLCLHSLEIFMLIWPKICAGISINGLEVVALGMFSVFLVICAKFLMLKS